MAKRTHGLSRHPLYSVWNQMRQRCTNADHRMYRWYGARGIRVCDRWLESFETFMADIGPRPDGGTLERIDNAGNYEPANCMWASRAQQARNRAPMGTYLSEAERAEWKSALRDRMRTFAARPHPERRLKPQPCAQCGRDFVRHGGHQEQRFCGHACYAEARRLDSARPCAHCGTTFTPKRRKGVARYCSVQCAARDRKRSSSGEWVA